MIVNNVTLRLQKNELALSMIVRLVRGVEIASLAKSAGLDSVYVDLEHCPFSLDTTSQICIACLAQGITPFVRLPSADPSLVPRILDGGALGIIIPHVEDAATAAAVVRAAKYPSAGARSYTSALPHFRFKQTEACAAMQDMNAATMVIAMIESPEGVAAASEIAAVDGVDLLHVGTNDLSTTLGVGGELDHPKVLAAYREIWAACAKKGKHLGVGGLAGRPDVMADLIAMGARYLTVGSDLGFLLNGMSQKVQTFRPL